MPIGEVTPIQGLTPEEQAKFDREEAYRIEQESEKAIAAENWKRVLTQVDTFQQRALDRYGDKVSIYNAVKKDRPTYHHGQHTTCDSVGNWDIKIENNGQVLEIAGIEVEGRVGDKYGTFMMLGDGTMHEVQRERWEGDYGQNMCKATLQTISEPDKNGNRYPIMQGANDNGDSLQLVNYDKALQDKGIHGLGNEFNFRGIKVTITTDGVESVGTDRTAQQSEKMQRALDTAKPAAPPQTPG